MQLPTRGPLVVAGSSPGIEWIEGRRPRVRRDLVGDARLGFHGAKVLLGEGEPHRTLLEPEVSSGGDRLRQRISPGIVGEEELAEERIDSPPPPIGDDLGQLNRALGIALTRFCERTGSAHRRRDGEDLHGDVDQAEQERLLSLEPCSVDEHAVEQRSR